MPAENTQVEGLLSDIHNARSLLSSPIFHDLIALVAAFSTPGKDDDKAAFKQMLLDANQPTLAAMVEPAFDLIASIIAMVNKGNQVATEDGPIKMMGASASGDNKSNDHILGIRLRLAGKVAEDRGIGYFEAYRKVAKVGRQQLLEATHKACKASGFQSPVGAEAVGFTFDGHLIAQLWAWIQAHPEVITALMSLLMMFI